MSASQPLPSTVTSTRSPVDVSTITPTSTNDSAAESFTITSLASIFELKLPTLQHVPKGARDAWAALLSSVCLSIARDPADLVLKSKFFICFLGVFYQVLSTVAALTGARFNDW